MSHRFGLLLLGVLVAVAWPLTAGAQPYPSEKLSFEGDSGQPEVFRSPTTSGSTRGLDPEKVHTALRSAAWGGSEGSKSLGVTFFWEDGADPYGWVRLTTFNGAVYPNPGLHTQGKIRFYVGGGFSAGTVGLCVTVRETGALVPQMFDGTTSGTVELVGVSLTPSVIECGTDDCQSTVAGDDILVEWTPEGEVDTYKAISWGPNRVLDTVAVTGDEERYGYIRATDGGLVPIPAVEVPPSWDFLPFEVNLATGNVTFNGTPYNGGIVTLTTGEPGTLADAPDQRGVFEALIITNSAADTATDIELYIDELQFESPEFDPIVAPIIRSPVLDTDETVTVTNLVPYVNRVKLFKNAVEVGDQALSPSAPGAIKEYAFTVPEHVAGDVYTAEQWDSKTPVNQQSPLSPSVKVLSGSPPFTFSILLDEDGNPCNYDPPGGWEWVGVSSVSGFVPQGITAIFPNSLMWQVVEIPLDDDSVVLPGYGGNGEIAHPSATGVYAMDSMWFTIGPNVDSNNLGPWEVFLDRIESLDSEGETLEVILDMEDGVNRIQNQRGQSSVNVSSSLLSSLTAYDGTASHRLLWTYPGTTPSTSLGMLQRIGYECTSSEQFSDSTAAIRFHMYCREPAANPTVPLPTIVGPIVVGTQETVRVNIDTTATAVQVYVSGEPAGSPIATSGESYVDVALPSLAAYDSISATQTIPVDGESDPAYPRVAMDIVNAPVLTSPIAPASTSVTVNGVYDVAHATASVVTVYVNDVLAGTAPGEEGNSSIVVTTSALANGQVVTATQTVNGVTSPLSEPVVVGFPAPVIYMAPAAGTASVRVMELVPGATSVTVTDGATKSFTAPVPPGADRVDVPVSGLVQGDVVYAYQSFDGLNSEESDTETVTTSVVTTILSDNFESYASQAALEAVWTQAPASGSPSMLLTDEMNATWPSGAQSLYASNGGCRVQTTITPIVPTAEEPVVWNSLIYDSTGPTVWMRQFTQLNTSSTSWAWFGHVGMWNDSSLVTLPWYHFRANGLGGPNWIDLDQYEAPQRSIGWHSFTVVHKGDRIDVYVDELLALKNLQLNTAPTLGWPRIGAGYASAQIAYYDDYVLEVGPVRFLQIAPQAPPPPTVQGPIVDGDTTVTITGVAESATNVTVWDDSVPPTQVGSVSGNPVTTEGVVVVPLVRSLVHLERIHATQTNSAGTSVDSAALEVGKGNGAILLSLGVRETGDTGPLGTTGGTTGQIEWIGASSASGGAPQGKPISPSVAWQTVTFDPNSDPILSFTGDGAITATRGVLEHLAVAVNSTSPNRSAGPYKLYVDNVVNVEAGDGGADFVITDFETHLGTPLPVGSGALFQTPRFSGSTDMHAIPSPNISEVTDVRGNPDQSAWLSWFFKDTSEQRWLRVTTSGTEYISRPIIDLTKPVRMDVLLLPGCATILGDLSGNGTIGEEDIALFVNCMDGPTVPADPSCVCGDFNDDDYIDLVDFAEFQAVFAD